MFAADYSWGDFYFMFAWHCHLPLLSPSTQPPDSDWIEMTTNATKMALDILKGCVLICNGEKFKLTRWWPDAICKQVMSLKKTGRKIERNANLILYFNASCFIYRVKKASLSMIDYDSVSGFQQRKSWYRNSFTNQDWINLLLHMWFIIQPS